MTKTEHYQLNQWEKSDQVLMDDFNADNAAIDGALTGLDGKIAAAKSDLDGKIETGLEKKADAASLTALTGRVDGLASGKAEQTALAALQALVAGKLDKSDALRVITGQFAATGTQDIIHYDIGARPKFLLVVTSNINSSSSYDRFFFAIEGIMLNFTSSVTLNVYFDSRVSIDDSGFTIDHSVRELARGYNNTNTTLYYCAFC